MKPGELVHVNADNFYHGVGMVVETECDGKDLMYLILEPGGDLHYYFPCELEPLDGAG